MSRDSGRRDIGLDSQLPDDADVSDVLSRLSDRALAGLIRSDALPAVIPDEVTCSYLNRTGKNLVRLAAHLGWSVRNSSSRRRAVLLAWPDDPSVTMLITPQIRAAKTATLLGKIIRYGDPALVAGLAERLRKADRRGEPGPEENLPVPRAQDRGETRGIGTGPAGPEPEEELTDAQVLDQIRRLADRGEYARQAERERGLLNRIADLEAELQAARDSGAEQLAEARAAVRERDETISSMRGELRAVQELISSIGSGTAVQAAGATNDRAYAKAKEN